ncbi:MAG: hypothetical protein QW594_02025 [Candidatus Woesearchaeota archaeon]
MLQEDAAASMKSLEETTMKTAWMFIEKRDYVWQQVHEHYQLIGMTLIAFLLPMFLSHPQLVVGSVINMLLFLAAFQMKGIKILPLIIAPSIGAALYGVLFGPLTIYLFYFIPFIWLANAILVYGYKLLRHHRYGVLAAGISVILAKSALLASVAIIFIALGLVPGVFLVAMGAMQLLTASLGFFAALGIRKILQH